MGVTLTQEMINGAIATQKKYGVPASVTLGQILLESGGNYPGGLSGLAYNDNNLFGIKAGSSWKGQTVNYTTTEYTDGKPYKTTATFRKYKSVLDSIDDHGKLLTTSIYTNKTNGATSLEDYVNKMGSVYATSPTYANNLLSIIKNNNLTQYDDGSLPTGTVNGSGNNYQIKWQSGSAITTLGDVLGDDAKQELIDKYGLDPDDYTKTVYNVGDNSDVIGNPDPNLIEDIGSKLISIIMIFMLIILAVVFLLKSFDIMPTKQNIISKFIPKETKSEKE